MISQRRRITLRTLGVLALVWGAAVAGYLVVQHSKMTVEKIRAYEDSVDLSRLSGPARAQAIDKLARMVNALSREGQREGRGNRRGEDRWFNQMTEPEKERFVEATMPAGIQRMIRAFEQLPKEQRERAVDRAMKNLRDEPGRPGDGGGQPPISDELRQKIVRIGLQQFYSQSSAETKAEVAPLLEQIQKAMETGRFGSGAKPQ